MNKCLNCPDLETVSAAVVKPKCFKPGCLKQRRFELNIIRLVNAARKKAGLPPLIIDQDLTRAAREKSKDMAVNRYFSHDSPTYGSPSDMIVSFGVSCRWSGENIASGFPAPEMVFREWMKSSGHRSNILKPEYTHIGVGYFYSEKTTFSHYWAQEFAELV